MCLTCSLEVAKLYDTPNCNAPMLTAVDNDSGRPLARLVSEKRLARGRCCFRFTQIDHLACHASSRPRHQPKVDLVMQTTGRVFSTYRYWPAHFIRIRHKFIFIFFILFFTNRHSPTEKRGG